MRTQDRDTAPSAPALSVVGLSVRERGELVEGTRRFEDLSWRQIKRLARYMEAWRADTGATVFSEGERDPYMCLIVDGRVKVLKSDSAEGEKELAVLGRGQVFGEMSLIDGEPRSATVVADVDSLLLVLTQEGLASLLDDVPRIGARLVLRIARTMSQRLRMASGIVVNCLEE